MNVRLGDSPRLVFILCISFFVPAKHEHEVKSCEKNNKSRWLDEKSFSTVTSILMRKFEKGHGNSGNTVVNKMKWCYIRLALMMILVSFIYWAI